MKLHIHSNWKSHGLEYNTMSSFWSPGDHPRHGTTMNAFILFQQREEGGSFRAGLFFNNQTKKTIVRRSFTMIDIDDNVRIRYKKKNK